MFLFCLYLLWLVWWARNTSKSICCFICIQFTQCEIRVTVSALQTHLFYRISLSWLSSGSSITAINVRHDENARVDIEQLVMRFAICTIFQSRNYNIVFLIHYHSAASEPKCGLSESISMFHDWRNREKYSLDSDIPYSDSRSKNRTWLHVKIHWWS